MSRKEREPEPREGSSSEASFLVSWIMPTTSNHPPNTSGRAAAVIALYILAVAAHVLAIPPWEMAYLRPISQICLAMAPLLSVLYFGSTGLLMATAALVVWFVLVMRNLLVAPSELHLTVASVIISIQMAVIIVYVVTQKLQAKIAELDRVNENLRENSLVDELTRAYNYRYFIQRLNEEMDRARRNGGTCALMFIDLDDFKHYNNVNGHFAGDEALKKLAELLKDNVRFSDTVARIGGEEFGIIFPGASPEDAQTIARRLKDSVAEHKFAGEEQQPGGKLTVSVGVSIYPTWADTADELLTQVDDALYHAKHRSGDRAELYDGTFTDLVAFPDAKQPLMNSFRTLLGIISSRDHYTYGHSQRVVQYAAAIASALDLGEESRRILRWAALLHDVGKIAIPKAILIKRSPLDDHEWDYIRRHPDKSAQIIQPMADGMEPIIEVVRSHHERIDGTGYPRGLKGSDMSLEARILAVADALDAMRSVRPYRDPKSDEEIAREMAAVAGDQFDAAAAGAAVDLIRAGRL